MVSKPIGTETIRRVVHFIRGGKIFEKANAKGNALDTVSVTFPLAATQTPIKGGHNSKVL